MGVFKMAWIIEFVDGKPVREREVLPSANITPEFKTAPDYHQELLQESKRLNDIMHAARLAAPI